MTANSGAGPVLKGGVAQLSGRALRLVRDNQAVYTEDIAVAGLARRRLAKSVHDAGWSQLLRLIEEKAARHGRYFARISRFEPTSQVCSAARNILAAGRADRLNARGGGIRPPLAVAAASETGTHRSAV